MKPELIDTIEEELREEFSNREKDNKKRKQQAKKKNKKSKKTEAEDSDTVNVGQEVAAKANSAQIDVCFVIENESAVSDWTRRIRLQIQEAISAIHDWSSEVIVRVALCGQAFSPLNFDSDLSSLLTTLEQVSVNRKIKNEPLQEVLSLDWHQSSNVAKAVIRIGESSTKRPSPADFSLNQIEVCWIDQTQSADFIITTGDHLIQALKRQESRQKRQE